MRTMIRQTDTFSKRIPASLAVLLLLLFLGLTGLVLAGTIDQPDRRISRAIERADTPWLTILFDWSSAAAMPLLLSLLIPIGWSLARRRWRVAILLAASGAGIGALNLALKLALRHNPPGGGSGQPIDWHGSPLAIAEQISDAYSYPSGHVATTTVALGLWVIWLWPLVARRYRLILLLAGLGLASSIAYSRVYTGHHVAVDILGGGLLGGAWLAGTVGAWGRGAWERGGPNAHDDRGPGI